MWNPFRIFVEHDYRWNELDKALTDAFQKIKSDKLLTFAWIRHFRKKELSNDRRFSQIDDQIRMHQAKIELMEKEILKLSVTIEQIKEKISPFPYQVRTKYGLKNEPISEPKISNRFMDNVVSMIRPRRKEYVIQKILHLVEKEARPTKQIETVIVKEKGLCGRTAFYDYLREMKHRKLIKQEQISGRNVLIST